ncbi:DedA family protein [Methanomassiliicoccus luminyensis]|uniref:DedA family protein n=1 Tax=Methanomassiliicoccus luminyensis TaxID=1080712 RepID=UPI00036E54A3|nr:DedA family protein [Methanomassiliicoccus luminyensis]
MNIIDTINQWVISLIETTGYLGIFLSMFVEGIFTPIPSEAIVPFAGYLASTGQLNLILVVLVASVGATAGSTVAYALAKVIGRTAVLRYGKYFGVSHETLGKADRWFERYGYWGVLIGHSIPGIRSIISFPAGLANMNLKKFMVATFTGACIWNTVLTLTGYFLGEYWVEFWGGLDGLDYYILAAAGLGLAGYFLYKRYGKKRGVQPQEES